MAWGKIDSESIEKTDLKIPNKYKKYFLYVEERFPEMGYGKQWVFRFPNNFGVSIIKHFGSFGYDKDLFEIAMLNFPSDINDHAYLYYCDITNDDVVGYLTNDEVIEYMERIKNYEETKDN